MTGKMKTVEDIVNLAERRMGILYLKADEVAILGRCSKSKVKQHTYRGYLKKRDSRHDGYCYSDVLNWLNRN